MKITKSKSNINPFGGFNFCFDLLSKTGIPRMIDQHLGKRVLVAGFDYSHILMSHLSIFFTGGDCAEDINEHLRGHLQQVKGMWVCSADTILRAIKELSTATNSFISSSGVAHEFNINLRLNRLLLKILKRTGQLNNKAEHTLDYDNQVIPTEKYDAKKTYKMCDGYQPGVACIGDHIVYIEGRNGNSPAKYLQRETLERAFGLLNEQKIRIKRFRADSASYQQGVVELVSQKSDLFYIRAVRSDHMARHIGAIESDNWSKTRLGTQEMEVAEIADYRPFDGNKSYRLIVNRIKRKDQQSDIFSGQAYIYRSILTNDQELSPKDIISFYNARGKAEKTFDCMNNDFGWNKLPCSFLNENTAFMILTAIYANIYRFVLSKFSEKLDWLKPNYRIKKFIFRFITVAAKWIRTARQYVLKLYTDKDYSPVLIT